jgi:UDP-GlcNAc:undecaprenyl-phosphate GlcNAc-1-phosphate transferase
MTFAGAALIAFIVALIATPLVMRLAERAGAVDMPGEERRIHTTPTPRWGGLAIYVAVLIAWLVIYPRSSVAAEVITVGPYTLKSIWIMGIGLAVVLFGMIDDRFNVPALFQAVFLLGCGIVLAHPALGDVRVEGVSRPFSHGEPGSWIQFSELNSVLFTAAFVFVIAKTMDTIDGIDGLAAGIAAISSATMLVLAYGTQPLVGVLSASAVGACLGFLRYNYHPAKIFMGTGGAQFLGFFLAAVSINGVMKTAAAVAFLVPLTIFGVQIIDAFIVVIRRMLGRVPITQADKRHVHHTLLGRGLSQRQAVWVLYLFAMVLCGAAILAVKLTL